MPKVVEDYGLNKKRHNKSWLVYLATATKQKVRKEVKGFPMELNGLSIVSKLDILPLVSYDALIRMDWIKHH